MRYMSVLFISIFFRLIFYSPSFPSLKYFLDSFLRMYVVLYKYNSLFKYLIRKINHNVCTRINHILPNRVASA